MMIHTQIDWHEYSREEDWTAAAAAAIAVPLRDALTEFREASLLLSGGNTPEPVYRALAEQDLDWDRVQVGLVDERWLPPTDDNSNGRLIRNALLRERAAMADFRALARHDGDRGKALEEANAWLPQELDVAVLGMGDDGHVASLFPGMPGLGEALASSEPYVAVDAEGIAGARDWPQRVSLTPAGMARARRRVLLIRGVGKRALIERALREGGVRRWPVLAAVQLPGAQLQVHWCP
jgi:6-phosphogluconolactonase